MAMLRGGLLGDYHIRRDDELPWEGIQRGPATEEDATRHLWQQPEPAGHWPIDNSPIRKVSATDQKSLFDSDEDLAAFLARMTAPTPQGFSGQASLAPDVQARINAQGGPQPGGTAGLTMGPLSLSGGLRVQDGGVVPSFGAGLKVPLPGEATGEAKFNITPEQQKIIEMAYRRKLLGGDLDLNLRHTQPNQGTPETYVGGRWSRSFLIMPDGTSSTLHEIRISELPVAPAANATDQLETNQAGVSRSITVGQIGSVLAASGAFSSVPSIGGFFEDTTAATNIYRFRDRVMVGDSVLYTGNRQGVNNYGTSWISQNAASYFIKNAFTSISTEAGNAGIAILGASRTAPGVTPTLTHAGIAGISLNEGTGTFGRAIYAEAMHKSTTGGSSGIEIQVGNYTATAPIANAYSMGSSTANGLSIGVEGGTGYTVTNADTPITLPTLPAGTAIDIAGGSVLATYQQWSTGIVFRNGALVRDGSSFAIAVSLAQKHKLQWEATSALHGASIWSEVTDGTQQVGLRFQNRHAQLVGMNDRLIVDATDDIAGAGAVNWLGLRNARTGISPAVIATGSDTNVGLEVQVQAVGATRFTSHAGTGENLRIQPPASAPVDYLIIGGTASGGLVNISTAGTSTNIDLNITPKGTGVLRFGTLTATGDVAITGSIQIRDSGGTFRKLAVIA